ncbi:transposase [Dickeya poaceiphila]|uniref:Mutator family transposase n=1 Tax=Dickeya poaceiphila TaxID=568768 RepID=A0A5B8I917_9GAMM|nr:transposase [Dickeya poaceiphila]
MSTAFTSQNLNDTWHSFIQHSINTEGRKELLGMWLAENEGAKFWLNVLTELKNRGLQDILIACVDGLKGFPDAINSVYPQTHIQLCIIHMVRNSLKYVSWKDYKDITSGLKAVYRAPTEQAALMALEAFQNWRLAPSVRIVVTPIENTNDKMGTEREAYFTRT